MSVRLIAITVPAIQECDTADELIAYCARVSNPANQTNKETSERLIAYLVSHQHWSPFEMAQMVVEITTARDIGRQILRHRSFSFQEFSQRYAVAADMAPTRKARLQDAKNRQASNETDDKALQDWWAHEQDVLAAHAGDSYREALQRGIAKEVARAVLPEGLVVTRMYMAGTVRSWIHYCMLRCQAGTQKEHRDIALACRALLVEHFPSLNGYV